MRGWEVVKFVAKCSYGCPLQHGDWAWFGKFPMVVCEDHAKQYGITRAGFERDVNKSAGMTSLADLVAKWKR